MADEQRQSPMQGIFPDPEKIRCRDCFNRDRTEVKILGKLKKVGITKSFCAAYPEPPDSRGKPSEILFQNADCPFYVKDK